MKNYYAILGVKSTASQDDIKRAFRQLAVKYHPDKNPDPDAAETFKEINEAYDVLGDWEKRKLYDLRWENPFADVVKEPQKPTHRDPKYRPKPPGYRPPKRHTIRDTMEEYLPYFRYISWAGIFLGVLLAIDFFAPYQPIKERLTNVEEVVRRGNHFQYFVFQPSSGKSIKVYDYTARYLTGEEYIVYHQTRIFRTVMYLSDVGPTFQLRIGYLYRTLVFFPLLLLVSSVVGVTYRKSVEFPFNLSILSGMLILITTMILIYL